MSELSRRRLLMFMGGGAAATALPKIPGTNRTRLGLTMDGYTTLGAEGRKQVDDWLSHVGHKGDYWTSYELLNDAGTHLRITRYVTHNGRRVNVVCTDEIHVSQRPPIALELPT